MRIILIALPWHDFDLPQPALGVLSAYLRQVEPDWEVVSEYAYLDLAREQPELYRAVGALQFEGERLYACLMYDRGIDQIIEYWDALPPQTELGTYLNRVKQRGGKVGDIVTRMRDRLDRHLDKLVTAHDWNDTIVGLTTSFSQLFGNLLLARRIKATGASVTTVLGGPTVSPATIADSIVATYSWIDYVVRGEGELPLHALVRRLENDEHGPLPPGVVTRETPSSALWQVPDLDVLPVPDYDAFFERAGPTTSASALPIEGSRGCWWDRTTKNRKSTCQFCNLNVQWDGYRQRSARNIATVMRKLADRYRGTHFAFLDNIVRKRGFDELIDQIAALDLDAMIFHEARANLRPLEILRFNEIGLRVVQFGLEGLSTSFLRRINKGTTAIMNLEVMKTCAELGVRSASNLILNFPGCTQQEADETVDMIDRYAFAFEPPETANFELGIDSVVMRFPGEFGIANVRNHDRYADVIAPEDFAKLVTFQFSYDFAEHPANWAGVRARVEEWRRDYRRHPLWYQDGGGFLHIHRRRPGEQPETISLVGCEADLYRFCLEIRHRADIHNMFAAGSVDRSAEIDAVLAALVSRDVMFQEGGKFLSLAVAPDALVAARRIRVLSQMAPPRKLHKLALVDQSTVGH